MIVLIILFKKYKFLSQRLILYLAISVILVNIGFILRRVDYENQTTDFYIRFCEFGGFLDQLFNWILLNAICAITIYLLLALFTEKKTEKYELVYIFFIFIFPFLYCWIPFIDHSYGRAGAWCWIRSEEQENCTLFKLGLSFQFALWYFPLYILMVVLIILYLMILVKIYRNLRKWAHGRPDQTEKLKREVKKHLLPLISYPLIFFILNTFPFINRVHNLIHRKPVLPLWYLQGFYASLGTWIVLAFVLDPSTRKYLTKTKIKAAVRDVCRRNTDIKYEEFEEDENWMMKTDSYQKSSSHPYKNYENCYKLNQSDSRNSNTL